MALSYYESLPPSFATDVFGPDASKAPVFDAPNFNYDATFEGTFGVDILSAYNAPGLNLMGDPSWTFITAPEDISWDVNNQATRVDMFGTNAPPVVSGTRGMRDLKLGNALVEGFVRNVTVEGKIAALEDLMNYKLNQTDGFVSVPVYQVWANEKSYGGSNAYYIIRDINIKETMRDLRGDATRAYVDISLMEVPEYQVNSGRDQASKTTAGVKSALLSDQAARNANPAGASTAAATASADKGLAGKTAGPQSATPAGQPKVQGVEPKAGRGGLKVPD